MPRRGSSGYAITILPVLLATAAQAQQLPVFSAGVELLEVDVSVVDGEGEPIPDLSASEFTVSVDGGRRRVVAAQFIDLGARSRRRASRRPSPASLPAVPAVSYTTNTAGVPGRLIVMAIARESISFGEGRPAMRTAADFLDTLNPNDQVALVTVPPPGPRVDFTTDRLRVREKLEMAVGVGQDAVRFYHGLGVWEARQILMARERGELFKPSVRRILDRICQGDGDCWLRVIEEAKRVVEAEERQRMESIWSLERILEGLRDVEGRKFVVWIAEELATVDGGGIEFLGIRSLAAAARASVHVILLRKPDIDASATDRSGSEIHDRMEEELGLGLIADYTGGAMHRVINNPEHAFEQLGRELSGYYLLGVEPLESDLDGDEREIDVSVSRRGARLRARREVVHWSGSDDQGDSAGERLERLLMSPLAVSDLPLRVATYAYQEGDRVRVMVASDVGRAPDSPDMSVGYRLIGPDGTIAASRGQRPEGATQLTTFVVDPGRYTLKLAAVEEGGREGSLEHRFDVPPMSAVAFAMGDLMLTDERAEGPDAASPPVEARLTAGRLRIYLELYADEPEGLEGLRFRIDIARTPEGPRLVSAANDLTAEGGSTLGAVSTAMRLDALPAGPYVARAVVIRQGEEIGRRWRSFEIARSPARLVGYRWRDAVERPASAADPALSAGPAPSAIPGDPPATGRDDDGIESLVEVVRPLVRAEREGQLVETERPFSFEPGFFEGVDGRTYVPYTITVDGGRLDAPSAALYVCSAERDAPATPDATGEAPACVFEDAFVAAVTTTGDAQAYVSGAVYLPAGAYDVYAAIRNDGPGSGDRGGAAASVDRASAGDATILLAKKGLTVPDFSTPELRLSSVLVGDIEPLGAPLPPERQRLEPYTIGTFRVVPRNRLSFSPREELSFLYFVHGAGPPGAEKPDLTIEYRFHRATVAGEQLFTWTEPERYDAQAVPPEFDMSRGHQVVAARAISLVPFPIGSYRLEIRVTDNTSGALATWDVAFTVQPPAP